MGLFGIIKNLAREKENRELANHKRKQGLDQMQQTRRCNMCGGYLFGNRAKRSQLICSNCGNRVRLY
jgi:hypothetical protein